MKATNCGSNVNENCSDRTKRVIGMILETRVWITFVTIFGNNMIANDK
jgi:hypothetical protein